MSLLRKNRILIICIGLVMSLFACAIIRVWSINDRFAKNMKYDENLAKCKYYLKEDNIIYRYKSYSILGETGFASVSYESAELMTLDQNGNIITNGASIVLFVWPSFLSEKVKYGVDIVRNDEVSYEGQLYIDENVGLMSEDYYLDAKNTILATTVLKENQEEISFLIKKAKDKWKL